MTHVEIECTCAQILEKKNGFPVVCWGCKGTSRITSVKRIQLMLRVSWYPVVIKNGLENDTCRD